jgi:hypothetical protein
LTLEEQLKERNDKRLRTWGKKEGRVERVKTWLNTKDLPCALGFLKLTIEAKL